ncbi:hypothetical protein D3C72_1968050 [compost metagenome]
MFECCIGRLHLPRRSTTINCATACPTTLAPVPWNWTSKHGYSIGKATTRLVARRGSQLAVKSRASTKPFAIRVKSEMSVGFTTTGFGITWRGGAGGLIQIRLACRVGLTCIKWSETILS